MTELDDLRQRLEDLEARLSEGGESLTPNYLTFDPVTGQVGASFTGKIHAEGLDLDAATSSTPPDTNKVRWIEQPGGAVVAEQFGWFDATGNQFWSEVHSPDLSRSALLELLSTNSSSAVEAQADSHAVTIASSSFRSHFLQATRGPGSEVRSSVAAVTCTWPGGNSLSNIVNFALFQATGNCNGIGVATGVISGTLFIPTVSVAGDGVGGVNVRAQHPTGAAPAAASTATIILLVWGN